MPSCEADQPEPQAEVTVLDRVAMLEKAVVEHYSMFDSLLRQLDERIRHLEHCLGTCAPPSPTPSYGEAEVRPMGPFNR